MADILSTTLDVNPPVHDMVKAHVEVVIRFSPREVSENMDYGVNVAVFNNDPDVGVFTRLTGMTAMDVYTIPLKAAVDMEFRFDSKVIRPDGRTSVPVALEVTHTYRAWPSGTKLKAVVTVVPEIAATMDYSQVKPVP